MNRDNCRCQSVSSSLMWTCGIKVQTAEPRLDMTGNIFIVIRAYKVSLKGVMNWLLKFY